MEKNRKTINISKENNNRNGRNGAIWCVLILPIFIASLLVIAHRYERNASATNLLNKNMPAVPFEFANQNCIDYVTSNIGLQQSVIINGDVCKIRWSSSNSEYIDDRGVVHRPTSNNETVTLKARVEYDGGIGQKTYELTVIKSDTISADDIRVIKQEYIESKVGAVNVFRDESGICRIYGNLNEQPVQSMEDAEVVIAAYRDLLQIPDNCEFKCINIQKSLLGIVYSFKQYHLGIEVADSYLTISTNDGVLSSINLDIDRGLNKQSYAVLTEDDIYRRLNEDGDIVSYKQKILDGKSIYEVCLVRRGDVMNVLIDAEAKTFSGGVKSQNAVDGQVAAGFGVDGLGSECEFNVYVDSTSKYYLYDAIRNIQVIDYKQIFGSINDDQFNNVFAGMSKNDWGYGNGFTIDDSVRISFDPISSETNTFEDELAVSLYDNFITVYDWYVDTLGRASYDGKGRPIKCILSTELAKNNAAYWPSIDAFVCGDTNCYDRPLGVYLDIIGHEYAHGVFNDIVGEFTCVNSMTSGIGEGYADVFGCLVDGNWIVAENLIGDQAMRNPTNEDVDLVSSMKYPQKYLDDNWSSSSGHINGILIARAAYLMSQNGFSNDDIARVWYQSMFYGYGDNSDFITVRNNVVQAAALLGYNSEKITIINEIFDQLKIA